MDNLSNILEQVLGDELKTEVMLKDYTRLRIGGPAQYFYKARNDKEVSKAKEIANRQGLTYRLLKPDENILVGEQGIKGLVIYLSEAEISKEQDLKSGPVFEDASLDSKMKTNLGTKGFDSSLFDNNKIPAAALIKEVGLSGKIVGQAQVSEENANVIINKGKATASEIVMLISIIKQQVRDKLGVQLQENIRIII